jgi:hypothetical protein
MNDDLFTDEPPPNASLDSLFTDEPPPSEVGLFGQTIEPDTTSSHGWDIQAGKPILMAPESEIRNEPGLQDVSVTDALAAQGAYGLGKLGVGLAGKAAGSVLSDALPAASKIPTVGKLIPNTENIVPSIGRIADNQTLKSLGGTMGQIARMAQGREGRVGLDKAAKYARDKGLADVWSTGIGRDKQLESLLESTGEGIGNLRAEAGPAQSGILEKVKNYVMRKYGPKSLRSAEAPAVEKTIEAVREATGKLPVVAKGPMTGKPVALFDYNDPITGVSSYKVYGDPKLTGIQTTGNVPFKDLQAKGIEVVGQTPKAAELGQAPLDVVSRPPTHAGYAEAATDINKYAAGNKMYQPITAETDVANALSRENNAGIVQTLGADKGKQYLDLLEEQTRLHPLEHLQKRGELRDIAGRGGMSLGKSFVQKMADAAGYRLSAKTAAAIHDLLVGEGIPKMAGSTAANVGRTIPAQLSDFLSKKYQGKGK